MAADRTATRRSFFGLAGGAALLFGLSGTDANGRDVAYDGSGTGNCFTLAPSDTAHPADRSTVASCSTAAVHADARNQMVNWRGTGPLSGWVRHAHPPKKGYKPLEDFRP